MFPTFHQGKPEMNGGGQIKFNIEDSKGEKQMNKTNLLLILSLMLGVSLGCLGPGADSDKCNGIVKFEGKTYEGASKTEQQAKLNACNKFCEQTDKELEAMYQIFLESDTARDYEKRIGKKMSKTDAIIEDKRMLDYTTKNCAVRCVKEANKGKHTLETSCK